ncbi:hypothetical protein GCM10022268_17360 [Sphingomonas cynarae]|uniref:Phage tail protein n=1 Tax=Sphingomonas cynarae TaxID=930197 RepID=A0ABP7DVH8_9SPHN
MIVVTPAGDSIELGTVETGATIGIIDYSRLDTDAFGITTVVKRAFARRMALRLAVPIDDVDGIQRRLAELRATSARWVADDRFQAMTLRGFYKDFSLDLATPTIAYCSLTVESLTGTDNVADTGADPSPGDQPSTLQLLQPVAITDATLVATTVAEDDHPEWSPVASYPIGARVIKAATHRIYESATAGNVGIDPAGAAGAWIDIGTTRRWAMFDQALGSVTSALQKIVVTLAPGAPVSALAALDVTGATIRVQSPGYDRTQDIAGATVLFLDMPLPSDSITVTIEGPAEVSIGTLLIGPLVGLGITEAGPGAGITDYSRKAVDDFGDVTIIERAFAKRMTARALIRTEALDDVAGRVASVRAQPSLWIGQAGIESLTVYGYFKDFSIEVGETLSKVSLSIEGLAKATQVAPLKAISEWPLIEDPDKTKPANNATNSGDPTSPFGNGTVADVFDRFGHIDDSIDELRETLGDAKDGALGAINAARDAAQLAATNAGTARDQATAARDAAGTARDQAADEARKSAGSAGTAQAQATIATTKAGEAGEQASIATGKATIATTKAGEASVSASEAATSKRDADGSASSAARSAELAAVAAGTVGGTGGYAEAAARSAESAAASATQAGQKASAAESASTQAQTAAGQATTYRDQASTSATNAAGSASTASTQAGLAATSAGQAGTSASAANTSAGTASTKADAAGVSASAANTSAQQASGFAGTAQSNAEAASRSAAAATGSASSASRSEELSAQYRDLAYGSAGTAAGYAGAAAGSAGAADSSARAASGSSAAASGFASSARSEQELAARYRNEASSSAAAAYRSEQTVAGAAGALAEQINRVETTANGASANASSALTAANNVKTGYQAARIVLQATSPGGRVALTLASDSDNGAGILLTGNVAIGGNLLVDGSVTTRGIASNAVTAPYITQSSVRQDIFSYFDYVGDSPDQLTGWQEVISVGVGTSEGAGVIISPSVAFDYGASADSGFTPYMKFALFRDGVMIWGPSELTSAQSYSGVLSFSTQDMPSIIGTTNYQLMLKIQHVEGAVRSNGYFAGNFRTIGATVFKR